MMCIYSVFGINHRRKTISFLGIAKLRCTLPAPLNHVSRKDKQTQFQQTDLTVRIYRGPAVWIKNIRHPWSAPLKGPRVSEWNQGWQCHIDPGHTPLFYWVGLNKIIPGRLRARQGRVNCSDPLREVRPYLPERTQPKKRPYQQDANRIAGRGVPLRSFDWQAN